MSKILENKTAIITGANQGLGFEIAKRFVKAGASIAICARDAQRLQDAAKELRLLASRRQQIIAVPVNVSMSDEVEKFIRVAIEALKHIDVLVNNAGIYGPMGPIEEVDWAEWIKAIEINLFGSILMCRAVLPTMKSQRHGKIIQLSGGGATNPMPNVSAYAVSKAAIVRFSDTLAEEVREFNIDVNAIAPGALNTRMLDEVLSAGSEKVGQPFFDRAIKQKENGGAGFNHGAELTLFLASDASNGITGKLISAVWDNWVHWPEYIDELRNSDVYTLRRIAGRDRGLTWGDK